MIENVNFLSWYLKSQTKWVSVFKIQLIVFLLVAGLVLLGWHLLLQQKIIFTMKQLSSLKKELHSFIGKNSAPDVLNKSRDIRREISDKITNLENQRANFPLIFKAIDEGVLESLYLTQLIIKQNEIKIFGGIRYLSDLVSFATKLVQIKLCQTLSVQKIDRQESEYNFILSCK